MKPGDIIEAQIIKAGTTSLIVRCESNSTELVHVSEISDYYVHSLETMFEVGEVHNFLVLASTGKARLSWKKIVPRYLKNPFKFEIEETENGYKNLLANTLEEAKND